MLSTFEYVQQRVKGHFSYQNENTEGSLSSEIVCI